MIKAKLELQLQDDKTLLASGTGVKNGMTAHADEFSASTATVAVLTSALTEYGTALQAATDGRLIQQGLTDTKNAKRAVVEDALRALVGQVNVVAKGNINIIHDAGMHGNNEPVPPVMTQVTNLQLLPSTRPGELLAEWDRVDGSRIYRMQTSTDAGASWVEKLRTTKPKCSLNHDLVSGTKVSARVSAIGTHDEGAWSEVVTKVVP